MYKQKATILLKITENSFEFIHFHLFVRANPNAGKPVLKFCFSPRFICSFQTHILPLQAKISSRNFPGGNRESVFIF